MRLRDRSARFTLIEILAVMAIIALLVTFLGPKIIEAKDKANVVACKSNLLEIYKGFITFEERAARLDSFIDEPGVRFFLKLWRYEEWEHTEQSAKKLSCPGVGRDKLPGLQGRKAEQWFDDWDALDGSYSAYAGRDIKTYPLKRMSGKEPLVCDDNDGGEMNHRLQTNVLMGDGSIKELDISILRIEGVIDEKEENILVGDQSPVELLRKFSLD